MNSRLELGQHLIERGLVGEGAEIGILFADFSSHLLANWPGTLWMIDPWEQQYPGTYLDGCNAVNMERAFEKTKAAVAPYGDRAKILRAFSVGAARHFNVGQLDFVYLDGNHSLPSVRADLAAWYSKVRSGGIISGHDHYDRHDDWHDCGVKQAVNEFVAANNLKLTLTPACTSWWIDKP